MITREHPLYFDVAAVDTGDAMGITAALDALKGLYGQLDERVKRTTGHLKLPCYPEQTCGGCSQCCHESVFLTPLEFFLVVDYIQEHWSPEQLRAAIDDALALYAKHKEIIEAFNQPGEHTLLAKTLKFSCPLLTSEGCGVYPAREVLGRLFGQSFNDEGGIYGCHLSGAFFGHAPATLVRATAWARQLHALPLTHYRQVYPYYFHLLWGA